MSQLVRAIMARETGERVPMDESFTQSFKDIFSKEEEFSKQRSPDGGIVYQVGVVLEAKAIVDKHMLIQSQSGTALEQAVYRTKQHIIQAVFGEFREDFYQLEKAIYERDFNKSRDLLDSFRKKMFEVD